MAKIPVKWGKKVVIRDPEKVGLENVVLHGEVSLFYIMPSFSGKQLDEKASTVYWLKIRVGEEDTYIEVLGEKRQQVLDEYRKQMS